jgi:hypothetical protein
VQEARHPLARIINNVRQDMHQHSIVRWVVPLYFAYIAVESARGAIQAFDISGGSALAGQTTGFMLCIVLGLMMYLRPARWGTGVGILFIVMVAIQSLLWVIGGQHLSRIDPGFRWHVGRFVMRETLNITAAAICISYRVLIPGAPNQSTDPTLASGTPGAEHQARHP